MIGQLYLIKIRGVTAAKEKIKESWLVNGSTPDECIMKMRYRIDLSEYTEFSVTGVEKIKPGMHMLSRAVTQIDDEPKQVTPEGVAHVQRTNQPTNGGSFAVGFAGSVGAADQGHALRLVAQCLIDHSLGRENSRVHGDRQIIVEEIGETDSTASPEYQNIYTRTSIFRGGRAGAG